ncbi:MAG: hypothetical protein K2W96_11435 [Gemmataceae bacterium]|nr:hypothetical protein [Gemmataceae bacterium]
MYELVWLGETSRHLDEILLEGAAFGQQGAILAALVGLRIRLTTQPHAAGEIKYRLQAGFPVHDVAEAPLLLRFAIVEQIHQVWVFDARRMSARGE